MKTEVHKASWWNAEAGKKVKCLLCPRRCVIADGRLGFCGVRENQGGELFSLAYGYPVAVHVDPIEKKPLVEFLPGSWSLSMGTFGCNLECSFCQNYHLSRGFYKEAPELEYLPPEQVVKLAKTKKCASISFTYNEPTIWAEYALDIAKFAKKEGIATVLVSNGYMTMEAAKDLYPFIDAANIDMKGFSEEFYTTMTGGHLAPVLESMKYFHGIGKHLEITNLVIPEKNDSAKMIADFLSWVEKELDKNVPLHFSAYHQDYKYNESPRTPSETLLKIKKSANLQGFGHVYLGNI